MKRLIKFSNSVFHWCIERRETLFIHLIFLSLSFWAVKLFVERSTLTDNSDYLFRLINNAGFHTPHLRFGAIIFQLLPKLFVWLHLPMKAVMMAYSLSPILISYLVFCFLFYRWKDKSSAWLLLLTFLVSSYHFFFWQCSEIMEGMSVLMIYRAFLRRSPNMLNTKFLFVNLLFAIVLNLFHPVLLFPFAFIIGMEWFRHKHWQNIYRTLAFVPAILIFLLRYQIFPPDAYESAKMVTASKAVHALKNFFALPVTQQFLTDQWMNFWRMLLVLVIGLVILIYRKKYFSSAWLLACWSLILFLVHATFQSSESFFSMANYYMPLSFVAAHVIADELQFNFRKWFSVVIVVVVFCSFNYDLFSGRWMYVKRQLRIKELATELRSKGGTKWIIRDENFATKNFYWTWIVSMESLMLTSMDSPDSSTTFYFETAGTPIPSGLNSNSFIEMAYQNLLDSDKLNPDYFHLGNEEYKISNSPTPALP